MTDTDKNPARSFHCSPRDFFISDSGNVAGVLLHADPETDADRVVRADSMTPARMGRSINVLTCIAYLNLFLDFNLNAVLHQSCTLRYDDVAWLKPILNYIFRTVVQAENIY